jgi:hypothetical protein
MNSSIFFGPEASAILSRAGWVAGRSDGDTIKLPDDVRYPVCIQMILREYGGLMVRSEGSGTNVCRNSIEFEPSIAQGESSEDGTLDYFSGLIQTRLYPVGYIHSEALYVCVDDAEKVYLAGDGLFWEGDSFVEGISNILLGIKGKQLDEDTLNWV